MIPQAFIQELLARVDVVEVVGRHVKLKKSGANWMGLCPFHNEKSPSFSVSPTKQFYHCFGCGVNGSAITFLMEHSGLSFVEAVRELAQSAGLQVPDEPGRGRAGQAEDAPGLTQVLATAARFYKSRLKDAPRAIEYLKGRGVSGETAARFGLGYAPDGWRNLEAAFGDYEAAALVEAGLVIASDAEAEPAGRKKRYDRFRDRVMFPIRDARGRTIGFGGRVLDRGEPKYLNSPETPVFSKGRELYGLFEAREALRRQDVAIVVEGYMDVVMLAQHGVTNAVATLGTATTPQHVQKLLRLVERVVFAFDGDAAGRKAAWRALEASLPQMQDTKRIDFLFLPPEHDPDSFVRAHGETGWREALDGALPLSEFLVRGLSDRVDLQTSEGRARLQAEAAPLLRMLAAPALRQQMVQRVAGTAGVAAAEFSRYLAESGDERADGRGERAAGGASQADPRPAQPHALHDRDARVDTRFGVRAAPPSAPALRAARPDAQRRARMLVALHPVLAAQWCQAHDRPDADAGTHWLPAELLGWLRRVAALPAGTTHAGLREALRVEDPALAESLNRELAAGGDFAVAAQLTPEEAQADFEGAVAQVQLRAIRQAVAELADAQQPPEALRERRAHLERQRRDIEARRDRAASAAAAGF